MSDRHLVVDSKGVTGSVKLDGVELASSLRGFSIAWDVNSLPVLTLDPLVINANLLHHGVMDVRIPQATHDALVALGWTPPAGET